jgi:hypothetical protein
VRVCVRERGNRTCCGRRRRTAPRRSSRPTPPARARAPPAGTAPAACASESRHGLYVCGRAPLAGTAPAACASESRHGLDVRAYVPRRPAPHQQPARRVREGRRRCAPQGTHARDARDTGAHTSDVCARMGERRTSGRCTSNDTRGRRFSPQVTQARDARYRRTHKRRACACARATRQVRSWKFANHLTRPGWNGAVTQ